ncbi:MAG TPA: DUF4384 domain-containing protein [Pyrinomonadaceae bacterium]|nr:DUF4384 domain-containing protein [Pyrinomonadaceae bacterium]
MRFKSVPVLATVALLLCGASVAARAQQQQDQKVIDDFVTTRGVSFDDPSASSSTQKHTTHAAPTHRSNSSSAASKNPGSNSSGSSVASNKKTPSTANGSKNSGTTEVAAQSDGMAETGAQTLKTSAGVGGGAPRPVGLGYTIYMKDSAGGMIPVDASHEYHSGDGIVIALEPNTEGYIYVFDAENDSNPGMLFPNVALDGGANVAHAHVRETYPTDTRYTFEFDNNPAVENVYVVVSRHPLEGVPTGEALVAACKKCDEYGWRPTAEQWQRIRAGATDHHVVEAKNTQIAQLQAQPVPPASLQRGIKIKRDDPAPAVVRVAGSPDADALVTVIKLVHK